LKNSSNKIGNTNLILKDVSQNGTNLDVTENNALFGNITLIKYL